MHKFFRLLILILLLAACDNNNKKGLVQENKLVKILADIHIADAVSFSSDYKNSFRRTDSVTYYESILRKYNITRRQFDSTIAWYSANPVEYDKVYEKVLNRLNRMQAEVMEQMKNDSLKPPVGNLWNLKHDWVLPDDGLRQNISFSIPIHRKGIYTLSCRIMIKRDDQSLNPVIAAWCTWPNPHISASDSTHWVRLQKTGNYKEYSIPFTLEKDTVAAIRGFLLSNDPKPGNWKKDAEVRNISVIYKPLLINPE